MTKDIKMRCDILERRNQLLLHPNLNGIDYIEVPRDDQLNIRVYFIKPSIIPDIEVKDIKIEGGVRIKNILVEKLDRDKWGLMLDAYYRAHGWDVSTGLQTRDTLIELNLEVVAEKLAKFEKLL